MDVEQEAPALTPSRRRRSASRDTIRAHSEATPLPRNDFRLPYTLKRTCMMSPSVTT